MFRFGIQNLEFGSIILSTYIFEKKRKQIEIDEEDMSSDLCDAEDSDSPTEN